MNQIVVYSIFIRNRNDSEISKSKKIYQMDWISSLDSFLAKRVTKQKLVTLAKTPLLMDKIVRIPTSKTKKKKKMHRKKESVIFTTQDIKDDNRLNTLKGN